MILRLTALLLLCIPSLIQNAEVPPLISLNVVDFGGNVTFGCEFSDKDLKFFYWYKQSLGHMAQTVASVTFDKIAISDQFNSSRFTVKRETSQFIFTIRNVSKEDEATYFCQSGTGYSLKFDNSTFLAVNDHNQQKCGYLKQSVKMESVQVGDTVTLQCSLLSTNKENRVQCPDEHHVFWFQAGLGGFNPSVIYTHRNSSNQDVKKSCVYSMSKTIQSHSDAGTYYCAVATCGNILFGEGTKVETRSELDPVVLVLGILLACCVAVIALLIFCLNPMNIRGHPNEMRGSRHDEHYTSAVYEANDLTMNYAEVDFSRRRAKEWQKRKECVYAGVRSGSHNQ